MIFTQRTKFNDAQLGDVRDLQLVKANTLAETVVQL